MAYLGSSRAFWSVAAVLLGSAAFFTVSVEWRRQTWASGGDARLTAGEPVELVRVIDGDELSVRRGESTFIVRLIGIDCFDSTMNDPVVARHGARGVEAIEALVGGAPLTIELGGVGEAGEGTAARDARGRARAYVRAGDLDIGERLVRDGHALVYTAEPFAREFAYVEAERAALAARRGIWRSPRLRIRIDALKSEWASRRAP